MKLAIALVVGLAAMLGLTAMASAQSPLPYGLSASQLCSTGGQGNLRDQNTRRVIATFRVTHGHIFINNIDYGRYCEVRSIRFSSGGGGGNANSTAGGHNTGNGGPASPQERVDDVFGNDGDGPRDDVGYTNDTTAATAGSGGQQQHGDDVPSRTVEQSDLGGTPSDGYGNETAGGNEAPDIF
ncbi:MAG TPA: hypothetical protein VKP88_04845 [Candidatus Paceibacterota bacterium]|nr:hypothetical protein [Candidatus Paceibacterota bacterium]